MKPKKDRRDRTEYYIENKEDIKIKHRLYSQRKRFSVLQYYGGTIPKCACCGETQLEFLCIDHMNGNGNAHRRKIWDRRAGGNIYQWLMANDLPSGFQVLCHNCNCAKGFYGACPHQKLLNIK